MPSLSNDQGRAFEYITLITLHSEISKIRPATIEQNSSFFAAQRAWNNISADIQNNLQRSANAYVDAIFDLEPLILEDDGDEVELLIQPDDRGVAGDVRDILIVRSGIRWEIGLSLKHNHFAVKHSRLGKNLDFADRWYGLPCSDQYWDDIAPIFNYLEAEKARRSNWRDLPSKENDVYIPLLNAFIDEVMRGVECDPSVPSKMVEYLLGEFDFYKVVSVDRSRASQILTFNLRGTLNQSGRRTRPSINVPVVTLPTRIVSMGFKPGSNNTVELYMDGGWQFSFRIHNASTAVETSLKFDIQIVGMPATIISINCRWN